jgi:sugar phosphate isomerase/epimerase
MKLSMVISTQPSLIPGMGFQGDLETGLAELKRLEFDGVELAVRDPKLLDLDKLGSLLQSYKMPVAAIATGQAFSEEGLSLTHPDENIRQRAVERIKSQIELAGHLNAIVIIGLVRGQGWSKIDLHQAECWLAETLTECCKVNKKVKIAIEAINRYETDLINTAEAGLRFLDKMKVGNIGLHLDTFHMNIEEPCIKDSILACGQRLFHFHIADSNRRYPGAGHIDFLPIVEALGQINYPGFLSAEILPLPDSITAAQKTIEYMRKTLND